MGLVKVKLILFCLFANAVIIQGTPATAHIHSYQHESKEREEDGAYIARDHDHMKDGEHHSEFDHEAILGSTRDAEEFDHLPPEEAKRRLKILLTKMDLNKDGNIDRNELHAWILRSFKMLSEEESREKFESADENEDGKVTWDEYVADSYGIQDDKDRSELSDEDYEEEQKFLSDDKIMFAAADANKDNILDKHEFLKFSHPEEDPDMLPVILKKTLEDRDLNSDGAIDFQEFIGDGGRKHDKEWLIVEKDRFDKVYDVDHDGKLNSAEILSWVVPSNDEIAEEEVDHLFASSDDDHDEILTFDEVLDNHDVFVGSEATDYGEHLQNIHVFQDEL